MSQKAYKPTDKDRQTVEILVGYGIPVPDIGRVLGVSERTVYNKFRKELANGKAKVQAKLVGNLLRLAGGADGTALKAIMFSLNCRFGWSQYAPQPPNPGEQIGKKAAANIDAQTAHHDTGWKGLVQ